MVVLIGLWGICSCVWGVLGRGCTPLRTGYTWEGVYSAVYGVYLGGGVLRCVQGILGRGCTLLRTGYTEEGVYSAVYGVYF